MNILALLPDDARHVLERSLTGDQHIIKAGRAASVAAMLTGGKCDAFVIDPGLLDADEFAEVLGAAHASRVPMLLYTALEPLAASRIVQAVELEAREIVLRGSEDMPELLQRKLAALVTPSAPAMLLRHAAPHLRMFPDRLKVVSVSLFARGTLPRWVDGLATESGLARRSVDRWMHRGGISGASRLLDTARLARVWEPLVERNLAVDEVAVRCGYNRQRLFTAHSRRIAGATPLELQRHYTRETFTARLAAALIS